MNHEGPQFHQKPSFMLNLTAHTASDTASVYIQVSAIPGIGYAGFDGRNKTMSKMKTFPYCMTLRLTAPMETELENLAYDRNVSKAGFIRRCLRRAIAEAYEHVPDQYRQDQGGAL